jgi:hypothetical protein
MVEDGNACDSRACAGGSEAADSVGVLGDGPCLRLRESKWSRSHEQWRRRARLCVCLWAHAYCSAHGSIRMASAEDEMHRRLQQKGVDAARCAARANMSDVSG